jgi:thiosulfate/3-mercaptopyruvate sulfurtransferase
MRDGDVQERRRHSITVGPLVTPDWLAARLGDPRTVVADVRWYLQGKRGIDAYRAGHLPGAHFVDVDGDLSSSPSPARPGRHPLPSPGAFAAVLSRIGVRDDSVVVAYDDVGGAQAARLWWLLRYFGRDVGRVLDGGIQAWVQRGGALDTAMPIPSPAPALALTPHPEMVVDKARVRALSAHGEGVLLDARAAERYEGKVEPVDARPGHIPGAKSAPFVANLTRPGGPFLSADELARHYAALGADAKTPIVAYCGSGVTACHDLLALHVAGKAHALLYEGSWSDWASDATLPATRGPGA